MDPERPAQPTDRGEHVEELRPRDQHLGELVDHHQQRRQRWQVRSTRAGERVLAGGRKARRAEQLLAPEQLAGQRVVHPVDQGEVVGEVGHGGGDVGQWFQAGEGRATLEVDQHEVEQVGRVVHDQPEDQGAQQLGLAGAGRPDHEPVGSGATPRRLLQVEVEGCAGVGAPDHRAQELVVRTRLPGLPRVRPGRDRKPEQGRHVRGARVWGAGIAAQREHPAGQHLGGRGVAGIGRARHRWAVVAGRRDAPARAEPQVDVAGRAPGREVEHREPTRVRRRFDGSVVDHEQQVGVGRRSAASVGEPPQPVPPGGAGVAGEGDGQPLRRVEGRRLRDHRPREGPGSLTVTLDHDPPGVPEVEGQRQPGHPGVGCQQPLQGVECHRVGLPGAGRRRLLGRSGGGSVAHRVAHDAVRRVLVVPLPRPPARHDPGERVRRGMVVAQPLPLLVGRRAQLPAYVGEVAQVAPAYDGAPPGAADPYPVELHQHQGEACRAGTRRPPAGCAGRTHPTGSPSSPRARPSPGCRASGRRRSAPRRLPRRPRAWVAGRRRRGRAGTLRVGSPHRR